MKIREIVGSLKHAANCIRHTPYAFTLGLLWIGQIFGPACALYNASQDSKTIVTTCNIPNDQSGTITGHWLVTPIPIAFHQNDFGSNEIPAMTAAADSWNQFF